MTHGTVYTYKILKCHCEACRARMRPLWRHCGRRKKVKARTRAVPPERHRTIYCYRQGCRCEGCVTAIRRYWMRSYYVQAAKPGARRKRRLKHLRAEARHPELVEAKYRFFASRPRSRRISLEAIL